MARGISQFKLGLFILICGGLLLAIIIWLGVSQFFAERNIYATYFDESVRGIQSDTTVNYRGVSVGKVESIGLAPDGRLIEVLMGLQPAFKVSKNLTVQLREQGLTGLRYLEIDTIPEDLEKLTPEITFKPKYPLIPSVPSELQQLKTALENIYEKFLDLDMKSLLDRWTETAEHLNSVLSKAEEMVGSRNLGETLTALRDTAQSTTEFMQEISRITRAEGMQEKFGDLAAILKSTRETVKLVQGQLEQIPPGTLGKIQEQLGGTIDSAQKLFTTLDHQVNQSSVLTHQTLQQVGTLVTQLNRLIQTLQQQPSRLLFPSEKADPFERK